MLQKNADELVQQMAGNLSDLKAQLAEEVEKEKDQKEAEKKAVHERIDGVHDHHVNNIMQSANPPTPVPVPVPVPVPRCCGCQLDS